VRRAALALYTWVAVLLGGGLMLKAIPTRVAPALLTLNGDGVVDWIGARALREGYDPYSAAGLKRAGIEVYGFGHPPTTPFWFLPFTRLGPMGLHQVTGQLVVLMLLVHLIVVASELALPAPLATATLAFGAVLSQSWMQDHLAMVQLGEPIAFLYVLAWVCLRREQPLAGGALLGLACTLKLFPGLMLLYLLVTRRWRAAAAAAATWLAVAAYMTAHFGLAAWPEYFAQQPSIANTWMAHVRNGSLHGVVLRLFWPACQARGPTLPLASALSLVAALAILVALWRATRGGAAQAATMDASYAAFSVASVFLNPWVWEHYYVLLLFPLLVAAALLGDALRLGLPRPQAALLAAALLSVVALLGIDMHQKQQDGMGHLKLHAYEVANWLPWPLVMAILAALAVLVGRRRARLA
jgi:alpha-1,2-mannosyltransferase